jgi:hypothetical protein
MKRTALRQGYLSGRGGDLLRQRVLRIRLNIGHPGSLGGLFVGGARITAGWRMASKSRPSTVRQFEIVLSTDQPTGVALPSEASPDWRHDR